MTEHRPFVKKKKKKPDLSAPVLLSDSHSDRPGSQQKLDSVPDTQKPTLGSGISHRIQRFTQKCNCWPISGLVLAERRDGQRYLVATAVIDLPGIQRLSDICG